jgi:hypothetical protein
MSLQLVQTADILKVPTVPDAPRPDSSAFLNDPRPKVRLPGDNHLLSDTALEVGTLLQDKDIFCRGGLVFHAPKTDLELLPMTPETFRTWCEQHLLCFKVRPSADGNVIRCLRTMSGAEAEGILAAPQFLGALREVERFNPVRMPVRRKSGEIVLLPEGYDAESLSFTASTGVDLVELSPEEARTIIENVLREFSFNDSGRSKAVAVAAMLTVFGIGLLPPLALPPCFIFLANREGAGKTLLAKVCTVPVLGYAPTAAWPKGDEEMDKRLLAAVMGGLPVLILDNVRNHISSGPLELFLTNSHFKGRILGQSKEFVGRKSTVVFLTGNGATVSPDMRRRSLFAELFLGVERAEDRTFKVRLEAPLLLKGRARILSALWSLIRSWDQAGRPKPSRINSGFSDWSEVFGGIVEHAGFGCALETPEIEGAADTDLADMRALVERVANGQHRRSVDFAQLVAVAQEAGLFTRLLPEEGEPDRSVRSAFSKLLSRYHKCSLGNLQFNVDGKGHQRRFRIEQIGF